MRPTLETLAVVASLLTFAGGLIAWYSANVQKRYAAQRDFAHLQRSYEQLASNQSAILKELDEKFDELFQRMEAKSNQALLELKDVKGLVTAAIVKGNVGDNSSGWARRPDS